MNLYDLLPFKNCNFKEINNIISDKRNFFEIYLHDFCDFFDFLLRNINTDEDIQIIYVELKKIGCGFVSQIMVDDLCTIQEKIRDTTINYKFLTIRQRYELFGKNPLLPRPGKEIRMFLGKIANISLQLKPLKLFKLSVPEFRHFGYESCTITLYHEPKIYVSWGSLNYSKSDLNTTLYHNGMVLVSVTVYERYTRIEINFDLFKNFYPLPPYKKSNKKLTVVDLDEEKILYNENNNIMIDKKIKLLVGNNMENIIKIYLC